MKKFDWFTILAAIAIAENTIFIIAQGSWWIVVGLIFGGIWLWIAYWSWRHKQEAKMLDVISRLQVTDIQALSNMLWRLGGVTVDEFNSAFDKPQFIGDTSCLNNARSPYLRCAINPDGGCLSCKDYEKI
jgi:hypothetical protein